MCAEFSISVSPDDILIISTYQTLKYIIEIANDANGKRVVVVLTIILLRMTRNRAVALTR